MDYESFLRKHRKRPLFLPSDLSEQLNYGREEIQQAIPHRDPVLLLDELTHFDLAKTSIVGLRHVALDDPVFRGHFPGDPVYPGLYQIEALGQLATALTYFLHGGSTAIDPQRRAPLVRATKILGAYFVEPILPGTTMTLLGVQLDTDGFTSRFAGQALQNGRVACIVAGELCLGPSSPIVANGSDTKN